MPILEPEVTFHGCNAYVDCMLKVAQAPYAKEVRRAAHHSDKRRSRVRTAAADISNLSTHQVEHDRPSKRRQPTASVIATVNSQEVNIRRALHPEDQYFEPLRL
eukprot:4535083-Pleurochrysis_carterae.AAC.3